MQALTDVQAFDFVFRSTSDGFLSADAAGLIRQINPAGAAMLGIIPEDIIGKPVAQAFRTNAALVNLMTREGDQTLDIHLPRRRLAVGMATTLETGKRVALLHDITERRELDTRREALIKAISHDLRNPISAITGFADLVAKFGDLNSQQAKFITRIRQTSSKIYDVIGSLVDLAWIEAGMPLEYRPLQMADVVNQAVSSLTSLARKSKIVIAVSLQNPLPTVMGDPVRLEQVVYNLLHNAITYSSAEQTIVIHAWGDTHEVYCSVADRGIGIADDELELVFDRLYRGNDERVRDMAGGGLGLTIARTIVIRHGGDIWASSNLGLGSTFTFVLPTVEL
jgi:two-component system, OmpR family, phosphate regulon sensor histidine kinase PhoR